MTQRWMGRSLNFDLCNAESTKQTHDGIVKVLAATFQIIDRKIGRASDTEYLGIIRARHSWLSLCCHYS